MSKKLYVLISDGGDGSYSPAFTMDVELLKKLEDAYDRGVMLGDNGVGVDGDGFHYTTINVPDDATDKSLGIRSLPSDYADKFAE